MMLMVWITAHVYALQCIEYSCKSTFDSFEPEQCLMASDSGETSNLTISLSVCTDMYFSYCPPVYENASCQLPPQSPTVNIAYVGEPCMLDENCISSLCINYRCSGLSENYPCQSDLQCNVGLYCNSVCISQLSLNSKCSRDQECYNNLTCISGFCSPYLSLAPYTPISSCVNNFNFQCTSGGCFTSNQVSYCLPQVATVNKNAGYCYQETDCSVPLPNSNFGSYNTECQCSQNGYATMTCALAPGDKIYKSYISQLGNWINSTQVSLCHTTQRLNLSCVEAQWDYKNFVVLAYFQMYAQNFPTYQFSDSCVQTVFQNNFKRLSLAYQQLTSSTSESSSAGELLTVFTCLFLVS